VEAVNGLDLEVAVGECFGLLGPNGAGKTTTIEICEGLVAQDAGTVELLRMRWDSDAVELRQRLGVQLQETQLSEKLTVVPLLNSKKVNRMQNAILSMPDVVSDKAAVTISEAIASRQSIRKFQSRPVSLKQVS